MAGRLLVLCPGQGAQHPAMFDMARSDPATSRELEDWLADPALAPRGGGASLSPNPRAPPALGAATRAWWPAGRHPSAAPSLVAGYSIGELAAYGVAGALAPLRLVRIAAERARLMDACVDERAAQGMVALSGMPHGAIEALLTRFGFHPAILTGEDAVVAGGPAAAREALAEAVLAAGGRATALPVEVASHTPLLQGAVMPFAELLARQAWSAPAFPVLSGISAEQVEDARLATRVLSRQIAEPIRWMDCMDACVETGVTVALELGPGAALSRMLQARHPHIACRSVTEFRSLDGIRSWLGKQLE